MTESRLSAVEARSHDNAVRVFALESAVQALQDGMASTVKAAERTRDLVEELAPEVIRLRRGHAMVKHAKKGGWAGVFMALGILLESYGPAIARWLTKG